MNVGRVETLPAQHLVHRLLHRGRTVVQCLQRQPPPRVQRDHGRRPPLAERDDLHRPAERLQRRHVLPLVVRRDERQQMQLVLAAQPLDDIERAQPVSAIRRVWQTRCEAENTHGLSFGSRARRVNWQYGRNSGIDWRRLPANWPLRIIASARMKVNPRMNWLQGFSKVAHLSCWAARQANRHVQAT